MYSDVLRKKNGRLFCCIATHFRGCNGIGDLLTRQARNFIYTKEWKWTNDLAFGEGMINNFIQSTVELQWLEHLWDPEN